jgi:hypothetical protein
VEYPGGWDRLTGALHCSSGAPVEMRWAFLCHLGLVRTSKRDSVERFARIVADVEEGHEAKPGPSLESELAGALRAARLITRKAGAPDPFGEVATDAWEHFQPE